MNLDRPSLVETEVQFWIILIFDGFKVIQDSCSNSFLLETNIIICERWQHCPRSQIILISGIQSIKSRYMKKEDKVPRETMNSETWHIKNQYSQTFKIEKVMINMPKEIKNKTKNIGRKVITENQL